ncbi:MAG: bile acid:sodium symporter family protein [Parasphingorhabdus sp.]|uniref:bile acid:sodium symporter family protein n=1 Tax=Parasphingorhabdus sp. TaxID=2709688 RepID=UPI0032970FBA
MQTIRLILTDKFIWLLGGAVLLATVLPVGGQAQPIAAFAVSAGIFWIFLLHGIRLDRQEVAAGFRNWKLQSAVFGFVFGAMVLAGLFLSWILGGQVAPMIAVGFLYLGCLPSTIQSAASYTAIAKGNVGASVVAAATVNLSSIVLTPVFFALLASSVGIVITGASFIKIMTMLLLPFVIGQLIQSRARPWVAKHSDIVGWSDKLAISLAVYVAFSGAVVAGIWQQVPTDQFMIVGAAISVLLAFAFGGSWLLGGIAGFVLNDRKALLFGGAQKSIAVGAPLAAILFPPENAGLLLVPLLFYHLSSLVLSAPLAVRLAKS